MEKQYLVLNSNRNEIPKFDNLLEKVNGKFNLAVEKFINLQIACSEAIINAIVHGNKENDSKKIYIIIEYDEFLLSVRIKDEGTGFNVDAIPDPTSNENILKESGRGIFIIRSLVDDFKCISSESGTEYDLTVKK
ncbi:MAG: ATP-binding protein [Ignavibacteria bacterium]|nr:ATP-binding protein [Ignavibacteria bacterium]